MISLKNIELTALRQDESFAFMKFVHTELSKLPADPEEGTSPLTVPRTAFTESFEEYDRALAPTDTKDATAEITACDDRRDRAWYNAFRFTEVMCEHPDETIREYAQLVMKDFERYGSPLSLGQEAETSLLHNLLNDVNSYSESIIRETFNLGPWIDELNDAEEAYEEALHNRAATRGAKTLGQTKAVRRKAEEAYRNLANVINAAVVYVGEAEYVDFIEAVNDHIDRAKAIVKARRTRSANEKEETPAPETGEEANV